MSENYYDFTNWKQLKKHKNIVFTYTRKVSSFYTLRICNSSKVYYQNTINEKYSTKI